MDDQAPSGVKKTLVNFTNTPTEVMNSHIIPNVVAMVVAGCSVHEIARDQNMNRTTVRKIMASHRFRELLEKTSESTLKSAVAQARSGMARLVTESLRVIENKLKEDSLEAVKIVMKGLGVEKEEGAVQDTNLTVILPGAKETSIEVSNEVEDESN